MADKITVDWHEIESEAVEAKLRANMPEEDPNPVPTGGFKFSRLIYHTLVYSALFGIVGGFIAGIGGEIIHAIEPKDLEEFEDYWYRKSEVLDEFELGEISEAEMQRQVDEIARDYPNNSMVAVENSKTLSEEAINRQLGSLYDRYSGKTFTLGFLYSTWLGTTLALCLSIGDPVMGRNLRGCLVNGSVAIAIGFIGSIIGLFSANFIYSSLGGGDGQSGMVMQIIARSLGWGVFGGFLAIAPGIVLMNWKRSLIGLAGGLIGGMFGGALFDVIGMATQSAVLSRFVVALGIGALTGLGSGLLESAAKSAWVRVSQGIIAGKQFILYKESTYIGSSPQCEVYLFKDASVSPRHAAIHKRGNHFELEHLGSGSATLVNDKPVKRTRLNRNDRVRIGSTELVYQDRSKS